MKLNIVHSGLLAIASLAAAATPKGEYVLLDQGVAANQNFCILASLTLDGAGNVTGAEVFRSAPLSFTAEVKGTFTMTSANSGTMSISAVVSTDEDAPTAVHNYRFLVAGSEELQAVRTDSGVFSASTIRLAQAAPKTGALALNELDRNAALLAQLTLDGNGVLSGSAVAINLAGQANPTVSGTYTAPATGLGAMTVSLISKDNEGNEHVVTQSYRTAASRDGIVAIRTDPGAVSVANLEVI